jgi:hypothetical protein|tara:strand:- start:79 stop:285 length:207 start_codon:yes stop_codon:yes gene_type:complete
MNELCEKCGDTISKLQRDFFRLMYQGNTQNIPSLCITCFDDVANNTSIHVDCGEKPILTNQYIRRTLQ